jgi:lysophospholipid acyltransferase (LPLAT)-like uncharacterized protein
LPEPGINSVWTRIKAWIICLLARLLFLTIRVRLRHEDRIDAARRSGRPLLYAFWHGRQLGLLKGNPERGKRLAILTSQSRDGQLQTGVMRCFGLEVVRGSSSRGGLAGLVGLTRKLRSGASVGMAVDGPRGPIFDAKPGIFALARQSGSPIVPISVGFSRYWELRRTWDGFRIPKPFATAWIVVGQPRYVDRGPGVYTLSEQTESLSGALCELTELADAGWSDNAFES